MLVWKQKKFINMYLKAICFNPIESLFIKRHLRSDGKTNILITPDQQIIEKFHNYLKKEDKYSKTIAPHLFPLYSFIPLFKKLELLPYPLFKILNQGVELSILKDIPRKDFNLSVEIETPVEEENKVKLPQIVNLTSTDGEVFLKAKIHGVIPKKSNKTKSKREVPHFEAEHEIILKYTKEKARRFALITGDVNPIHLSSIIAKIFGFKSSIMHGFGILSDIFEEIEASYGRIESIKISFIKPVILNSKTLLEIEPKQNNKPTKFKLSTNSSLNVIGEFILHPN